MTTATLGFEIRSEQAATAKSNLDKMTAASEQAEQAQRRLATASAGSNAALARIATGVEQANAMLAKLVALTDANSAASTRLSAAKKGVAKVTVDGVRSSEMATAALRQEATATDQVTAAIRRQNAAEAAHIARGRARAAAGVDVWGRTADEVAATRNASLVVGGAANQNRPLGIGASAQGQVAQAEAVTRAASSGAQSVRMLAAGLTAAILPVSLLQFGIFALASATAEWAVSMLTGAGKTEKALERHKQLIDEIAKTYPKAAEAAKLFEDAAQRLPASVAMADALKQAEENAELYKKTVQGLVTDLQLASEQGNIFGFQTAETFGDLSEKLESGEIGAVKLGEALGKVRLDKSTNDNARAFAESLRAGASDAAKLEGSMKGIAAASQSIDPRQDFRGDPGERSRLQKYNFDNAEALFYLQKQRDLGMMGIGARSPAEQAALARAREESKPVTGQESATVRRFREDTAASLAFAQAQHMIDEAQQQRNRSLDNLLAAQELDTTLIGKTAGEAAKLRMEFDLIAQVREEAARNGIKADEDEIARIRQKAEEYGKLIDLQTQLNLTRDLAFERSQTFLSSNEQQIASRLRGTGLGTDSPQAEYMRQTQRMEDLRANVRGFFDDFQEGLMRGDSFGKSLGNAILSALTRSLDTILDNLLSSITNSIVTSVFGSGAGGGGGAVGGLIGSIFGGGAAGDAWSGLRQTSANDNFAAPLGTVMRGGGGAVDLASGLLGFSENANASQINSFLKSGGVDINAAQTAWCAAFVNSSLKQIGVDGSGSLVANSFLDWGNSVDPSQVLRGDVLVQSRGLGANQTGGHVGFATGASRMGAGGRELEMLSGNQNNSASTDWIRESEVSVRRFTEGVSNATSQITVSGIQVSKSLVNAAGGLDNFGGMLSSFMASAQGGGSSWFQNLSGMFGGAGGAFGFMNSISPMATMDIMSGSWGAFADGTENAPPGWAWVGEEGPELRKLRGGDVIRSNARSMDMIANQNSRAGSVVNISVINNAGVSVQTQERQESDGSMSIDVMVDRVVADKLARRGTASNNTLRKSFGAQQALKRR